MFENYITINKKFKSSVNLSFDLNNEEKIEQYIPTTDLCDVIKKYVKTVLKDSNFRSTTLSGPYGKGKSYLLLMILYLLSKRENRILFDSVCSKIRLIDEELYELLQELDNEKIYLLPVIINNNLFSDMNKNFIFALSNSLEQFSFIDIVPNTSYQEALDIISKWELSKNSGFDLVKFCVEKKKCNLADLKDGLKKYDSDSFEVFKDLYHCISQGLDFFAMKSDNIVNVYSEVARKIQEKDKNCKGIFIVFDEFGSFLNNQTNEFSLKLNVIQSFAEMCNESDLEHQLHFCCITHKDILLYKKDKAYNDAFDTIAGRFEAVRFDRSLDENYQILCSALYKHPQYKLEVVNKLINKYSKTFDLIKDSGIFSEKQFKYVVENGLPLNPIALYSLIQISEKVAQNERTLFTFIADNDVDGFRYFITNFSDKMVNVDIVYNYFSPLLKENDEYRMIYYKVETLKNITLKETDYSIFKAIAIIKIINDPIKFNCNIDNLAMSLALSEEDCLIRINELIEKKVLKRNLNDGSIDFAVVADDSINKLVSDTAELKFSNIDLGKVFSEFDKNKYEISHEYNFKNQMVRYYKTIYLEASKLIAFNNLNFLVEEELKKEFFDGLIINLINDIKITKKQIIDIFKNNNPNIIVRYVKNDISKEVIVKMKEVLAAKYICNDKKNLSDNAVKTLPLLIEDMTNEINQYLRDIYSNASILNKVDYGNLNLSQIIYNTFTSYYCNTLKFNNEQVNKNDVQAVTIKSRNAVMDAILQQKDVDFGKTSQEATIYNSFLNCKSKGITKLIENKICESNGEKIPFSKIIDVLKNAPYGLRNGIIPLLVSKAISNLSVITDENIDTVLLYNENIEVDMNGLNVSKACLNPDRYYFCYTQVNSEKIKMTNKLISIFGCKKTGSFSDNVRLLNTTMKNYVRGLAPVIVKSNKKDNLLNLSSVELLFKDQYLKVNNNNYELLFNLLPNTLTCSYEQVENIILNIKDSYEKKINDLYYDIINNIKNIFDGKDGNLKSIIDLWMSNYAYVKDIVFDNKNKNIYKAINSIDFNDKKSANLISSSAIKCSVEDLNSRKYEELFNAINNFKNTIINYKPENSISKSSFDEISKNDGSLSSLGQTLYSNILEQVEEYGSAVSNEEKALIYKKLLSELLG